jgi:hypothetical protein
VGLLPGRRCYPGCGEEPWTCRRSQRPSRFSHTMLMRYGCCSSRSSDAALSTPSASSHPDRPRCRDVAAIPRPGVLSPSPGVALKKGAHLVRAAHERFLGRDHHDVSIRREELHDGVGVPRCEPGAEPLRTARAGQRTAYAREPAAARRPVTGLNARTRPTGALSIESRPPQPLAVRARCQFLRGARQDLAGGHWLAVVATSLNRLQPSYASGNRSSPICRYFLVNGCVLAPSRLLPVCCPKLQSSCLISEREVPICRHFARRERRDSNPRPPA